jgi:spore germination cell wall hydrolase CwlJ-like protein
MAAYATAGLALVAAMLIFVLPVGGNAAAELLEQQPVVLSDNPRIEQMDIDSLLLSEDIKPAESPDAPTVTSALFDDSEKADAAAMIIEAAEATPTPEPTVTPDPAPTPIAVDELVEFFVDDSVTDYNETGYATNSYEYTDDELYLLAQIIDIEARGEPFEGMVAVGNVVMNRVLNTDTFGDTITRVVKSGQFAWSGHSHRRPSLAAKRAARAVLDDEYWVLPQNVYFFKSHSRPGKDWGRNQYYTTIKGHCFYLYGYSGRYNGDGIPPKLYERTFKYAQYGGKPEERVLRIQQMLNAIGFRVNENSSFDKDTREALLLFQETNGLNADGVATPDTITALIKAYGFENYVSTYVTQQDAA